MKQTRKLKKNKMLRKKLNGEERRGEMFYYCIKPKFILKNTFSPEEVLTNPTRVPGDFTKTEH